MSKMNPKVKSKWLKELRSGEVDQCRGRLLSISKRNTKNESHSFCCLGVLCNVYSEETNGVAGYVIKSNGSSKFVDDTGDYYDTDLTDRVMRWAGLNCYNTNELIELNDVYKNDFNQIADWIEKNL